MLPRLVIQIALVGSQVVFRSVMDAWKKATIKATEQGASAVMSKSGLSLLEARKILGIGSKVDVKDLNVRYKKLFEANATDKSGSFYLQSKVVRAKERLEEAIKNKEIEM